MSYKPPFTITADILNLVAKISQQVGELNANQLDIPSQQRKQNRMNTIAGTLAIEGNILTEEQITGMMEGKADLGSVRELAEVKGMMAAYDALPSFTPSNIDHLLTAHGVMFSDSLVHAGEFRHKSVGSYKSGAVRHVAPPAHHVSGLMMDLTRWLKHAKDHPLITSSVFHYEFEFIHPFEKGNGCIGRLWQTLILSNWHPLFLSLPLESVIKDHKKQYFQALELADQQADSTPFIYFMLSMIAQTLAHSTFSNASVKNHSNASSNALLKTTENAPKNASLNSDENASINASLNVSLNSHKNAPIKSFKNAPLIASLSVPSNAPLSVDGLKTPEAIVVLIQHDSQITRQQIADILNKDVRTIGRAMAKLQQAGMLMRVGSSKTGHWEV